MSTTLSIEALLADLPSGHIFTTGELLGIGTRDSIDKCLQRFVHKGVILRLARGVFSNGSEKPYITPMELAQIKARAFQKEVFEHPTTTAQRLGFMPKPESAKRGSAPMVFATNGTGSSSFQSIFGRIHLKATSARKRNEYQDEVWELTKSLWQLGKNNITSKIYHRIATTWGRKSQHSLQTFCASIPQWVRDKLPADYAGAFKSIQLKMVPQAADAAASAYHESPECKEMVRNMPPGFSTFEPPERDDEEIAAYFAEPNGSEDPPELKCWCPESDECICPLFACWYCITQPVMNRFSVALG